MDRMDTERVKNDYFVFTVPDSVDSEFIDTITHKMDAKQQGYMMGWTNPVGYKSYYIMRNHHFDTNKIIEYIIAKYNVSIEQTIEEYGGDIAREYDDGLNMDYQNEIDFKEMSDTYYSELEDDMIMEDEARLEDQADTRAYFEDGLLEDMENRVLSASRTVKLKNRAIATWIERPLKRGIRTSRRHRLRNETVRGFAYG